MAYSLWYETAINSNHFIKPTFSWINLTQFTDGERLSLGSSVILKITGECEPCSRMDEIRPGLQSLLDGKRGMLAYVESGGEIKIGDGISSL